MISRSSSIPLWLRLAGLLIAVSLFIWIPFEDLGLQWVLILSAAICAWCAVRFLVNRVVSGWQMVVSHALAGCLAGLAVAPLAALLMLLKSGLHGHGAPDFTVDQIQTIFGLAPYLSLSGLLIGFGFGLWRGAK